MQRQQRAKMYSPSCLLSFCFKWTLHSSPGSCWYKSRCNFRLCPTPFFVHSWGGKGRTWRGVFCGKYRPCWGLSKPLGRCYVNTLHRAGVQGHPKQTGIRGKKSKDSSAWVSTSGQWVYLLFSKVLIYKCFQRQIHIGHFYMREVKV